MSKMTSFKFKVKACPNFGALSQTNLNIREWKTSSNFKISKGITAKLVLYKLFSGGIRHKKQEKVTFAHMLHRV